MPHIDTNGPDVAADRIPPVDAIGARFDRGARAGLSGERQRPWPWPLPRGVAA